MCNKLFIQHGININNKIYSSKYLDIVYISGFVWKNPLRFYPSGLIRINPPGTRPKVYRCGSRAAAITALDFEDS